MLARSRATFNLSALGRLIAMATLLSAGLVLLPTTTAVAVTTHRVLNDTRPVGAGVVHIDFTIEHFGLVGELRPGVDHLDESGVAPFGQAGFLVQGRWTG